MRRRTVWYCALLVVFALATVRLAVVVSQAESGWSVLAAQWRDACFNWFGLGCVPIADWEPEEQAGFWLAEVDRLTREHPDSAPIHMGAAWVLDSPSIRATLRPWPQMFDEYLYTLGPWYDDSRRRSAFEVYEQRCASRRLELSARPAELQPDDVRWWRLRALLLFEDASSSHEQCRARSDNWMAVLDECERHDPGNALYDYLSALQGWIDSAIVQYPDPADPETLIFELMIEDEVAFNQATQRFLEGQAKPSWAIGEAGYPAIADFIARSDLSPAEQLDVALSCAITNRQSWILASLYSWQQDRFDLAEREGDFRLALDILLQTLRLYDQALVPEETSALATQVNWTSLPSNCVEQMRRLVDEHPDLMTDSDVAEVRRRDRNIRTESAIGIKALQDLEAANRPKSLATAAAFFATEITLRSATVLLVVAVLLLVIAWPLTIGSIELTGLGLIRHVIAWSAAWGGTFLVLGMGPTELISCEHQRLLAILGVWAIGIGLAGFQSWLALIFLRDTRMSVARRRIIAACAGAAVFSLLVLPLHAVAQTVAPANGTPWLKPKPLTEYERPELLFALKKDEATANYEESLSWAGLQWAAFGGLYLALALSLALTALWYMWRQARQARWWFIIYWKPDFNSQWASLCRFLGRSALIAATSSLLLYFLIAPTVVRMAEAEFQRKMRYCRDPHAHWSEIREAMDEVRSSEKEMQRIHDEVQQELDELKAADES